MSKKKPVQKTPQKKPAPQVKKASPKTQGSKKTSTRNQYLLIFSLLVAIFVVYSSSFSNEFINYDDDFYIVNHPYIQKFSFSKIGPMFSEIYGAQYAPIPFIALGFVHMIGGFDPIYYIVFGLLMHLTVTYLVFVFIRNLTGKFNVAILTAAMFGLAPMLVEAVTWIAGMCKTASYGIFFMGALIAYLNYTKTNKIKHLVYSILLFLGACLCKEQAVALTLTLIALDIYLKRKPVKISVLVEKVPFLLISLIFGYVTLRATGSNKEINYTDEFSLLDRIIYASYALVNYMGKLIYPYKLSFLYPYPSLKKAGLFYIYPLILSGILIFYFWAIKKKKDYIVFGGLFFIISIIFSLALQIISVREIIMADRYVYISSIGLFFVVSYGAVKLMEKYKFNSWILYGGFGIYLIVMAVFTSNRTKVWRNSETAFTDVIKNYRAPLAYLNRGYYYKGKKQYDKAIKDYTDAILTDSNYAQAYQNRGAVYFILEKDSLAYNDFTKAISKDPKKPGAWSSRGAIWARKGKFDLALKDLTEAIKLNPEQKDALTNRALVYYAMKDYEKAIGDMNTYLKLFPEDADMYNLRGLCYAILGQFDNSLADYNTSIRLKADQPVFYQNRSSLYLKMGDKINAKNDILKAQELGLKVDPAYLQSLN